jgi:hypothetical protein
MISIICVYNNESVLNNWLLCSLKNQSAKFEMILIDNRDGKYKSAASALNWGGNKATGEYLCFVHQDVHFCRNSDLETIEYLLSTLGNLGVAGVAGMSTNGSTVQQSQRNVIIEHEDPPEFWGNPITEPEIVQTVDECLFVVPKKIFNILPFDEETCNSWHFYAVDYCLSLISMGFSVYALPVPIHHQSLGFSQKFSVNVNSCKYVLDFYKSLSRLLKKHKTHFRKIYTTNGIYRTDIFPMVQDLKRIRQIVSSKKKNHNKYSN